MKKIRYKHPFRGDVREVTVVEYIKAQDIGRAGGYGYGRVEQLEAELEATRDVLLRLIEVVAPALDEDEIRTLCASYREFTIIDGEEDNAESTD